MSKTVWARFETELAKRTAEIERRHGDELQPLVVRIKELESAANVSVEQKALEIQRVRTELEDKLRSEHSQTVDLNRRVEDYFREIRASGAKSGVGGRDVQSARESASGRDGLR